jgi:hypothetical protein
VGVESSIGEPLRAFTCWSTGRGNECAARDGRYASSLRYCESAGVKGSSLPTAPRATCTGGGQRGLSTSVGDEAGVSFEGTFLPTASGICASPTPGKSGWSSLLGDTEESGSGCWKSYLNMAFFVVLDQASSVVQMRKVRSRWKVLREVRSPAVSHIHPREDAQPGRVKERPHRRSQAVTGGHGASSS